MRPRKRSHQSNAKGGSRGFIDQFRFFKSFDRCGQEKGHIDQMLRSEATRCRRFSVRTVHGRMDGRTDRWTDRRPNGRTGGWTHGRTDGRGRFCGDNNTETPLGQPLSTCQPASGAERGGHPSSTGHLKARDKSQKQILRDWWESKITSL